MANKFRAYRPSPMKQYFLLMFCLLWPLVVPAAEQAYDLDKSYLIEQDAGWSVEDVQHRTFKAYQNDLSLGFQEQAVWLRLDIKPRLKPVDEQTLPTATHPLILRMSPYVLDSAVLYEPQSDGWLAQALGDRVSNQANMCPDGHHCFALHSDADQAVTVFLRVHQRGIFTTRAEVVTWQDLPQVVAKSSGKNGAALAVSVSLLLLGVALLVVERSMLLLAFCCFEAVVVLLVAATTGVLSSYLDFLRPETLDLVTHHLFNIRVMMFVLVGWAVMSFYKPSPSYKQMVVLLMGLNLLTAVFISLGWIKWAIMMFLTVTGLNLILQLYALVITNGISIKIRTLLGLSYGVYVLVFINALMNLFPDLFPGKPVSSINSFSDWRTSGGPAGLVVFLFAIIHNAEQKLADSKALGQLKVKAAQSMANEEKLSERQTLIDMLTHELKNPLGTIRFALAAFKRQNQDDPLTQQRVKRMDMSVERMNDLIEQVAGSNKIDRFELSTPLESIDAAELIQEFITDEHADPRFKVEVPAGAQFQSHRRMLSLILENLMGNAAKYADAEKDILIKVSVQPDATVFQVRNQVPPAQMPDPEKLFKRFYRHDHVQDLPGLGIGLSLVQTAAEKIGAHVGFDIEHHTITFTLKVPA